MIEIIKKINKLNGDINNLKYNLKILKKEVEKEIEKEIEKVNDMRKFKEKFIKSMDEYNKLKQKTNNLENCKILVTEHAIVRFIERVLKIPILELKKMVLLTSHKAKEKNVIKTVFYDFEMESRNKK